MSNPKMLDFSCTNVGSYTDVLVINSVHHKFYEQITIYLSFSPVLWCHGGNVFIPRRRGGRWILSSPCPSVRPSVRQHLPLGSIIGTVVSITEKFERRLAQWYREGKLYSWLNNGSILFPVPLPLLVLSSRGTFYQISFKAPFLNFAGWLTNK